MSHIRMGFSVLLSSFLVFGVVACKHRDLTASVAHKEGTVPTDLSDWGEKPALPAVDLSKLYFSQDAAAWRTFLLPQIKYSKKVAQIIGRPFELSKDYTLLEYNEAQLDLQCRVQEYHHAKGKDGPYGVGFRSEKTSCKDFMAEKRGTAKPFLRIMNTWQSFVTFVLVWSDLEVATLNDVAGMPLYLVQMTTKPDAPFDGVGGNSIAFMVHDVSHALKALRANFSPIMGSKIAAVYDATDGITPEKALLGVPKDIAARSCFEKTDRWNRGMLRFIRSANDFSNEDERYAAEALWLVFHHEVEFNYPASFEQLKWFYPEGDFRDSCFHHFVARARNSFEAFLRPDSKAKRKDLPAYWGGQESREGLNLARPSLFPWTKWTETESSSLIGRAAEIVVKKLREAPVE